MVDKLILFDAGVRSSTITTTIAPTFALFVLFSYSLIMLVQTFGDLLDL